MNSEDDPEARIRALEQPLAETARDASEAAESQSPSKWAAPSAPPQPLPLPYSGSQLPPLAYSGSQFGQSLQTSSSRNRTLWIVAAVFVIGTVALPIGIMLFTAHQVSHSVLTTMVPIPSISFDSPAPSGGLTQTPAAGPTMPPAAVPTARTNEDILISGINETRTVACNQNTVRISGVSNTVVITGHCTSLSVSGLQNKVTVEAVDSIDASGFSNQVTYLRGSPRIDQSGEGNDVHQR